MRKRIGASVGVLMAMAAIAAPSASGATEFGDTCAGEGITSGNTVAMLDTPGFPLIAPSPGVITKLKTNVGIPIPFLLPTSVKVLRPAGTDLFAVAAQATIEIPNGIASSEVRMPVQAGDHLGLHGLPFSFEEIESAGFGILCKGTGDGRSLGVAPGDVQPGQTASFPKVAEGSLPLVAVVEPDGDGDGYGDETQDLCPQGAAVQAACPALILDAFPLAGKKTIAVFVSSSLETSITVSGKIGKAKLKKKTKTVKPGKLMRFKLKLPGKVKSALADLPAGKSLTARITASGPNLAGAVSVDKAKVKLK